jgi:hypothetical protein
MCVVEMSLDTSRHLHGKLLRMAYDVNGLTGEKEGIAMTKPPLFGILIGMMQSDSVAVCVQSPTLRLLFVAKYPWGIAAVLQVRGY